MHLSLNIPQLVMIQTTFPALDALYLFGSQASGHARADSDVDLAILVNEKVDPVRLWDTAQEIASVMERDVDLVDLRSASTVFQWIILTQGQRL